MIKRILIFLLTMIIYVSCNKYARDKYLQMVSRTATLQYINSCYSASYDDLNQIPISARNHIEYYLTQRIGKIYCEHLTFETGYVLSDEPIETGTSENELLKVLGLDKQKKECDTTIDFPVYAAIYNLRIPEIGIEKIGFNVMIDNEGKPVREIEFPTAESSVKIIPIDSVHSELIRRRIPFKNLSIDLLYDEANNSLIWSTTTLVREGSIAGPSCFTEYEHHFKMNALTGEITEYDASRQDYVRKPSLR